MAVKEYMTYEMTLLRREQRGIEIGEQRGIKIGEQRGIKVGEQRGINNEKENVAKKMLESGTPLDFIHDMTELSVERIRELAAQVKTSGIN